MVRVVCVSDTHMCHDQLVVPDGDIFIHCGDFTNQGTASEIARFSEWLSDLPHKHKIIVAGNHDFLFEKDRDLAESLIPSAIYLQDKEVDIDGLRIYGTPWTPQFFDWAFMKDEQDEDLMEIFSQIPPGLDILISHGPARTILDANSLRRSCGSSFLLHRIWDVRPRCHVFGHIHESFGRLEENGTVHLNVSSLSSISGELRPPVVFEIEPQTAQRRNTNDGEEAASIVPGRKNAQKHSPG